MVDFQIMEIDIAPMHKFLTSMEKYKTKLPFYIDNLYSKEEMNQLRILWDKGRTYEPIIYGPNEKHDTEPPNALTRYRPKHIKHMSRMLLEFEMPKSIEQKLDQIAKPLYDGDIALCHYNYIEYNLKFGDGNDPILPPHLDGDENLVTINTNVGGNVDWDIYIDGIRYELPVGKTVVFSAINQVHWRPKRKFKDGEYLEILSADYCPTDNYRFSGKLNPIDPLKFPEQRKQHVLQVQQHPKSIAAWDMYNAQ